MAECQFLALSKTPDSLPKPNLPEIAFVGKSNAGKSSLINTLVGQKIARSSSTPGRTQGLCFFQVRPNLTFVDFPGYGFAKVSKKDRDDWRALAEHYYAERHVLRGTVWIYDLRRDPDALDQQMRDWLAGGKKPCLLALTKADTLKRTDWEKRRQIILQALEIDPSHSVIFSSKTKEGVKALWAKIDQMKP